MSRHSLNYMVAVMLLAVPLVVLSIALVLQIGRAGDKYGPRSNTLFILFGLFSAIIILIPFWVLNISPYAWNHRLRVGMILASLVPLLAAARPKTKNRLRVVLVLGATILAVFWYFNRVLS